MLLQTVLTGKARRAYATLPTENCTDYEFVKAAILESFELVPEAYRQSLERRERKKANLMWNFCRTRRMRLRNGVTLR